MTDGYARVSCDAQVVQIDVGNGCKRSVSAARPSVASPSASMHHFGQRHHNHSASRPIACLKSPGILELAILGALTGLIVLQKEQFTRD